MSTAPTCRLLNLPPGYHFLPTDDELVVHYLRPRLANANHRLPLPIFVYERILDYHPDRLIEKYRKYGEGRWFFFTARERKHLGGSRPNRTTPDNGHWNATGSIRPIRSGGVLVGCRRTLVFYEASRRKKSQQAGLPPTEEEAEAEAEAEGDLQAAKAKDGVKTEWTMYEYESLASEAEFEAIRSGNANKMDALVLCTIQKKKHHSKEGKEGGETKKSTKRKTKEEDDAPAAGDVEEGTTEGQDEDHVERTLMEAAAEPLPELAYHDAPAGVDNLNVDPNQNTPCCYLINSLSPVPMPPQETVTMAPGRGDNHNVIHQQNYYFINHSMNMKNLQPFHAQAATPPQELLPYSNTKMEAPRGRGSNTMDHMLQNRFVANMTPSHAPPVPGTGTYLSPRRSKLDVWEHSAAELPLKSEDAWWNSHRQAKLPWRGELNGPYVTKSLSLVPTPQQGTVMELAARGYNHTAMHQRNYFSHSMNMRNSQFHVQATLAQEEFLPYSSTKMAAPLGGGNVVDHHMLQNRTVNMTPAAEAHTFHGYGLGLSSSNYGHGGGDYGHLSTIMDHPELSRFSFPSQQSQGPLLNNQVSVNHQNSAASMVGYDQTNGVGLASKIV